jgi:hypothetical protein
MVREDGAIRYAAYFRDSRINKPMESSDSFSATCKCEMPAVRVARTCNDRVTIQK